MRAGAWLQLRGIFSSRGQEQLQVHVMLRATLPEPPPSSGGPSAYKMSLLLSHPTFPRTQAQAVGGKWMRRQEEQVPEARARAWVPLVANSVLTDQLPNAWLLSSHLIRLPQACYRCMQEFL